MDTTTSSKLDYVQYFLLVLVQVVLVVVPLPGTSTVRYSTS